MKIIKAPEERPEKIRDVHFHRPLLRSFYIQQHCGSINRLPRWGLGVYRMIYGGDFIPMG
jgi:hypothetical protein